MLITHLNFFFKKECISWAERLKINSECRFAGLKNDKLIYKCKECRKQQEIPLTNSKKTFPGIYQFCNGDLNKFVLLLRKGGYPYEYTDTWGKFNETELPPKKDFYSNFILENISDEDYKHAQKVWNVSEIKNLGEYHDLYVQNDILLLSDIFESFRNMS